MRDQIRPADRNLTSLGDYNPFENELLVQAEVAVEAQRERVEELKSKLREAEAQRRRDENRIIEETADLRKNNAILRTDRDLLQVSILCLCHGLRRRLGGVRSPISSRRWGTGRGN